MSYVPREADHDAIRDGKITNADINEQTTKSKK